MDRLILVERAKLAFDKEDLERVELAQVPRG